MTAYGSFRSLTGVLLISLFALLGLQHPKKKQGNKDNTQGDYDKSQG